MPLNLSTNDGDFTPFIKYNAKAGRWYIRADGVEGDVEVVNPTLTFDFDNIRTGWLYYAEGTGPEKVWDPSPTDVAPKPPGPKSFKRGFEVQVSGAGNIGLREFSSTAGSAIAAMLEIYAIYEAGRDTNKNKLPVFTCTGVKPITGKHGTNYAPVFKLNSWKDRSSLPFDKDSQVAQAQPTQTHLAISWSIQEALTRAATAGITRDELIASIKSRGHTGWNPERETPLLMAMIAQKMNDQDFPPERVEDDGEIPF